VAASMRPRDRSRGNTPIKGSFLGYLLLQ